MIKPNEVEINVYRDLSNRARGESDFSDFAIQLHRKRRDALNEDLAGTSLTVVNWGATNDEQPHELVQIIVEILSSPPVLGVVQAGVIFLGEVLSKAFSSMVADGVKSIISKLVNRNCKNEIGSFWIRLPDGSTVAVNAVNDVPEISVQFANGKSLKFGVNQPPSESQ